MKEVHLIYNHFSGSYVLYNSKDKKDSSRVDLGKYDGNGLVNDLKHRLDIRRKTLLFLIDFPEDVFDKIETSFRGTKIQTQKESRDHFE